MITLHGRASLKLAALFYLVVFVGSNVSAQSDVRLPRPTGPHAVGTTYFALTDRSRPETFTDALDDRRELLVRAWYPAARPAPDLKPEPLWGKDTREIANRLAAYMNLPAAAFAGLADVPSHSYRDVPTIRSRARFPVVIFSHGYNPGFLAQNTVQMEELASRGYVVFSIGHTYETLVNIYPENRAIGFSDKRQKAFFEGAGKISELVTKMIAASDSGQKEALLRQVLDGWTSLDESLRVWTADTSFVLDELRKMDASGRPSVFKSRLDMKRIGVMGMSFGGATAGQFCATDTRCRAGINLDGMQYGDVIDRPLSVPFMFMDSEDTRGVNTLFFERARAAAYYLTVKGSKHFNFTDFSLFSPDYRKAGVIGSIDGGRMERIMNDYTLAFFDKHLKNEDAPLLEANASRFTEVEFRSNDLVRIKRAADKKR